MRNSDESVPYFSYPGNRLRRPLLVNWTTADKIVFMVTVTITLALMLLWGFLVAFFVGLCILPLNIRYEWARLYGEIAAGVKDLYIQFVLHDKLFLADDLYEVDDNESASQRRRRQTVRFLREKRYLPEHRRYVIPIKLGSIETTNGEGRTERFGIVQQIDRPLVHVVARGRGSSFSSREQVRQHQISVEHAENLDTVANGTSLEVGFSNVRLTRPVNNHRTGRFVAENGQPLYFAPEHFELSPEDIALAERMQAAYDAIILAQRQEGVADIYELAVATIRRNKEMDKASRGLSDDKSLSELPILELGRQMVEAIQNSEMGVRDLACLEFEELCELVRASWDVTNFDFHEAHSADQKGAISIYPQREIKVGHDFVCMDGNWISSVRVTRPKSFDVTGIQSVFHRSTPRGVWSSMATVGEAISGTAETRTLIYGQSLKKNARNTFFKGRVVENPNVARDAQADQQQLNQMSAVSMALQFNDVLCIVASSRDQMIKNRKAAIARLNAKGYKSWVIEGRSRQIDGYLTGVFGFNRL